MYVFPWKVTIFEALFSLLSAINYCFGLKDRKGKYNSMFKWPQNRGSMSTESLELSGEEGFLPTTAVKNGDHRFFGLQKQKRYFKLFL